MLLVIDNYDSFTYNLVQFLGELGREVTVRRNDQVTVDAAAAMAPRAVVLSPGPCTPNEAGVSLELVARLAPRIPMLGVCLGHQSICQAFGARIVHAGRIMHGKTSAIGHDGSGVFDGLPQNFTATRYHSLAAGRDTVPACLAVNAWTDDGEIMGVRHREYAVHGVQFHPESIATEWGHELLRNFLACADKRRG